MKKFREILASDAILTVPELVFPFDAVFLSSELGVFSLSAASKSVE